MHRETAGSVDMAYRMVQPRGRLERHARRIGGQRSMDHKPSILQDLELGRPMEIDGMFDAPLALAHLAGVEVPTLELLVALCKLRARTAGLYK